MALYVEDGLISSLLDIARPTNTVDIPSPLEISHRELLVVKSGRWRNSICTVERKTNTNVTTTSRLCIYADEILSSKELELIKRRRICLKKSFRSNVSQAYADIWRILSTAKSSAKDDTRNGSQDEHSSQSQNTEISLVTSKQSRSTVSKESYSQTSEISFDTSKQSKSVPSKESASQTTEDNLVTAKQSDPPLEESAKATESDGGAVKTSDDASSSDQLKSTTSKKALVDDHVFAVPTMLPPRFSSRLKKTEKQPIKDVQSKESEASQPTESTPPADAPTPRRSSRLSSRSASEAEEEGDGKESKTKGKSSKTTSTTKSPKEKKEDEGSSGSEDETKLTQATRASRRSKK